MIMVYTITNLINLLSKYWEDVYIFNLLTSMKNLTTKTIVAFTDCTN